MTDAQCALRLRNWIEELTDRQVILRSDSPAWDWPWVEGLFQDYDCWPKQLRRSCGSINFDAHQQQARFDAGLASFWKLNHSRRHHALVDARGLQYAWKQAIRRGL
jgi:hypothetical protein